MESVYTRKCISQTRKNTFLGHFIDPEILRYPEAVTRRTTIIATLGTTNRTVVDMKKLLECGMNIARIRLVDLDATFEGEDILRMLKEAQNMCCTKYHLDQWPVATALEIHSWILRTGILKSGRENMVYLKEDSELVVTCDERRRNQCTKSLIFIDYPHLLTDLKVGMTLILVPSAIELICTEVSADSAKCRVNIPGYLRSAMKVAVKGMKKGALNKPWEPALIEFANNNNIDMVIIPNAISAEVIKNVRKVLNDNIKIIAGISKPESLENLDDILQAADAILLPREHLEYEFSIGWAHRMSLVQRSIGGRCSAAGKPLIVSGNIMEDLTLNDNISGNDVNDITNLIINGTTGIVVKEIHQDIDYTLTAIRMLCNICKSVETVLHLDRSLKRFMDRYRLPVNAAEACLLSGCLMARMCNAAALIVVTATGTSARMAASLKPPCLVLALAPSEQIARGLHLYQGVIPMVYQKKPKKSWKEEMYSRMAYAVNFAVQKNFILAGDQIVSLSRAEETSSFCDSVEVIVVADIDHDKFKITCAA